MWWEKPEYSDKKRFTCTERKEREGQREREREGCKRAASLHIGWYYTTGWPAKSVIEASGGIGSVRNTKTDQTTSVNLCPSRPRGSFDRWTLWTCRWKFGWLGRFGCEVYSAHVLRIAEMITPRVCSSFWSKLKKETKPAWQIGKLWNFNKPFDNSYLIVMIYLVGVFTSIMPPGCVIVGSMGAKCINLIVKECNIST